MKKRNLRAVLFIALAFALCTLGCSKSDNNGGDPGDGNPSGDSIKLVQNATLGMVIADKSGRTLYFFSLDANGKSGCMDGCTAAWPIYYVKTPLLSSGLKSDDFGTITRTDGKPQTTYKGWPLYYYAEDAAAGQTKGEGFGGKWFVAKADYSIMISNKTDDNTVQYFTDDYGKTLYAYAPDKKNINNYTKSDFSNNSIWPIYTVSTVGKVPSVLKSTDFQIITVFGRKQLTYKGWPLYYYGPDESVRGVIKGESSIWPLVNANSTAAVD